MKFKYIKFPLKIVGHDEYETYLIDQNGRDVIISTQAGDDHYELIKWIAEKSQEYEN